MAPWVGKKFLLQELSLSRIKSYRCCFCGIHISAAALLTLTIWYQDSGHHPCCIYRSWPILLSCHQLWWLYSATVANMVSFFADVGCLQSSCFAVQDDPSSGLCYKFERSHRSWVSFHVREAFRQQLNKRWLQSFFAKRVSICKSFTMIIHTTWIDNAYIWLISVRRATYFESHSSHCDCKCLALTSAG